MDAELPEQRNVCQIFPLSKIILIYINRAQNSVEFVFNFSIFEIIFKWSTLYVSVW